MLTAVTLSAIPVHLSIAVGLSSWAIQAIDKRRFAYLWCGQDTVKVGKCRLAWCAGIALRLRWLWLQETEPDKAWVGLPSKPDKAVLAAFHSATESVRAPAASPPCSGLIGGWTGSALGKCAGSLRGGPLEQAFKNGGQSAAAQLGARCHWGSLGPGDSRILQGMGSHRICRVAPGLLRQVDLEVVVRWRLLGYVDLQGLVSRLVCGSWGQGNLEGPSTFQGAPFLLVGATQAVLDGGEPKAPWPAG